MAMNETCCMLLPLRGLCKAVAVTCVPSGRTAAFSSARGGRGATDQVPEEPAAGSRQAPPAGASRAGGEGRVALPVPRARDTLSIVTVFRIARRELYIVSVS